MNNINDGNYNDLSRDFEKFWSNMINLYGVITCNCGGKLWKDQNSFKKRMLRCSVTKKSINLIDFFKNHVIKIKELDKVFEEIRYNYKDFYKVLFDNKMILTNNLKKRNFDQLTSTEKFIASDINTLNYFVNF